MNYKELDFLSASFVIRGKALSILTGFHLVLKQYMCVLDLFTEVGGRPGNTEVDKNLLNALKIFMSELED